ncbi:hypothetical protein HKX48_007431 [Thoreauomyces humboldtii]|nr:hypothetical protein HKX48_007431 [Thoreauomyces humboldtii]
MQDVKASMRKLTASAEGVDPLEVGTIVLVAELNKRKLRGANKRNKVAGLPKGHSELRWTGVGEIVDIKGDTRPSSQSHVVLKGRGTPANPRSYQVRWKSNPSSKREVKGEKTLRYYRIHSLVRPPAELSLDDLISMLEEVSQSEAFHEVEAILGKRYAWVDSETPCMILDDFGESKLEVLVLWKGWAASTAQWVAKEGVPNDVDKVWDMISDHTWCSDKEIARVLKDLDAVSDEDDKVVSSDSAMMRK